MSFPNLLNWRNAPAGDDAQIENHLRASLKSGDVSLDQIAAHFATASEPRHRARAAAAASVVAQPNNRSSLRPDIVDVAIATELVHIGTTYHHDVIDGIQHRHETPTANNTWGDLEAILAGDFLIARASELASNHGTAIASDLATTIGWMCEGRQRELGAAGKAISVEARLETLALSVGSLFTTAARAAGLLAEVSESQLDHLAEFGSHVGSMFAIGADIDRFTSGVPSIGLSPLEDLRRGYFTLPVLMSDSPPAGMALTQESARSEYQRLCDEGVVERALELLADSTSSAIRELENFDNESAIQLSSALGSATAG